MIVCMFGMMLISISRVGETGGIRGAIASPDFLRFNEVRVDHALKTIKIFIAAPIFVPSACTVNDNCHNVFVGPYIFSGAFEA